MCHVAPEVSQLSQLSRLDLSFNRLSDLPPTLSQLASSLVALGLTCNVLPVLPPVVTTLTALTRLDVAGQCALQYEQGESAGGTPCQFHLMFMPVTLHVHMLPTLYP